MRTTKALSRVEIKDADKGEVAAIFSTFDVIDSDGDVTLKGAFTDGAPVVISAYGHGSWKGQLPVGKGAIRELSTEAVMEGQFFMDTTHGADTFHTVKALSEGDSLQEWSYSLDQVKSHRGTHDGRQVRFLDHITVKEVSPVLVGAGVDTRTLETKSGLKFSEHAESVLADVDELITRATEVMALRAQKGKGIADSSADLLAALTADLDRLKELLDHPGDTTPITDDAGSDALAAEFLRFVATTQGVQP